MGCTCCRPAAPEGALLPEQATTASARAVAAVEEPSKRASVDVRLQKELDAELAAQLVAQQRLMAAAAESSQRLLQAVALSVGSPTLSFACANVSSRGLSGGTSSHASKPIASAVSAASAGREGSP